MAGFGQAFSRGLENARDRRHQSEEREKQNIANEKQDAFRMYYSTFQENQKYLREQERADAKRVRDSEVVAQLTGYDPRAVHSLLEADYTPQQIQDMYENGAEIESIVDATQGKQEPAANEQTKEMLKGSPQATPQGAPADPLANNPYRDEFNQKIAAGTGTRLDQVEQAVSFNPADSTSKKARNLDIKWKLPKKGEKDLTNVSLSDAYTMKATAKTPEQAALADDLIQAQTTALQVTAMANAKAKANVEGTGFQSPFVVTTNPETGKLELVPGRQLDDGTIVDQQGNLLPDARPQSVQEVQAIQELHKNTSKEVNEYNEKAIQFADAYRLTKEMEVIANNDEGVLGWEGAIAQGADSIVRNSMNTVNLIRNELQNNKNTQGDFAGYIANVESDIEKSLADPQILSDNLQVLALKSALFDAKAIRMAFLKAASMGQSGRDVSNQDFNRYYTEIKTGGNPGAFRQNNAEWLSAYKSNLDNKAKALNEYNSFVTGFEQAYGYKPGPLARKPEDYLQGEYNVPTIQDTDIKQSPDAKSSQIPPGYNPVGKDPRTGVIIYEDADGNRGTFD